jgi:serine/threonine-protein kinase RsbW
MGEATHRELTMPNRTTCLAQVRHAVLELVGQGMFPAGEAQLVALAVDEAVANVMEHAFAVEGANPQQEIQIILEANGECFRALIRDGGRRFDPTAVPDVDIRQHVRQGRKGGLGIYLIRRIMDEVRYEFRQDSFNELLMVKYVDNRARKATSGLPQRQEGVPKRCP